MSLATMVQRTLSGLLYAADSHPAASDNSHSRMLLFEVVHLSFIQGLPRIFCKHVRKVGVKESPEDGDRQVPSSEAW